MGDIRAYCLVARTKPHLWFFHPGYCKVALEPYSIDDLDDRLSHLTNACVQKTHPKYRESLRGKHIWSESDAEAELVKCGSWNSNDRLWAKVHEDMKRAPGIVFSAARQDLEQRNGFFDLLGVDFMLDTEFQLHL